MNRLALCALQESYSVKFGCSAEHIGVTGGHDRYIKSTNTKKHLVQVSFVLREDDYLYFRAFYQNWQLNPLPFLMKLIIEDDEYKDYIAQFVKNSCQFDELEGEVFKVSAQLSVFISPVIALTSKPYPLYFIEQVATDFNATGLLMRDTLHLTSMNEERVATDLTVTAATIRTLVNETHLLEQVETGLKVISAVVATPLRNTSMQESVNTGFNIVGAVFKDILIKQPIDVERISTAFTVTSAIIN